MPTDRLTREQSLQALQAYATKAKDFTPDECERVESRMHYTPRQEPEEMG